MKIYTMVEQKAVFAREFMAGTSLYARMKQAFRYKHIMDKRKEQIKNRKNREQVVSSTSLSDGKDVAPPPPPTLTEKVVSSARRSINLWTMIFIVIILGSLCLISWRSGMIQ